MTMNQEEKVWTPAEDIGEDPAIEAEAETLCRWAAARASVIVVAPVLGTMALMANEVYLINRLAKLYKKDLTEGAILGFAGSIGGTVAGTMLATLIPLPFLQIPIAVGVTYGVGKAAQAWLKAGMPSDLTPYIAMYNEWSQTAKEQVKVFAENPMKNVPLGDESREFIASSGAQLSDALVDMKGKISESLVANKDTFVEAAEVITERAAIGGQSVKESLADTLQDLAETLAVVKEHVMVAMHNRAGEPGERSCPMESVKDTAFFVSESILSHTDGAKEDIAKKLEAVSEVLKEVIEILTERTAMSAEELRDFATEKLGSAGDMLLEIGLIVKERAAMALPNTDGTGEALAEAAYFLKEKAATQLGGVVAGLKDVGEEVKEAGEVLGEHAAMRVARAKDALGDMSTGKKAVAVGAIGVCALLAVVSYRLADVVVNYKSRKTQVTPQDLARLTALAKEAKNVVTKVRRGLVEPTQA